MMDAHDGIEEPIRWHSKGSIARMVWLIGYRRPEEKEKRIPYCKKMGVGGASYLLKLEKADESNGEIKALKLKVRM